MQAAKITGMLLEMETQNIWGLLHHQPGLDNKVNEALEVLKVLPAMTCFSLPGLILAFIFVLIHAVHIISQRSPSPSLFIFIPTAVNVGVFVTGLLSD